MKKDRDKANMELVAFVIQEFEKRKAERKSLELQWQLNRDYLNGKQNNYITKFDTVVPVGQQFYWQEREVFNHVLPMIEARLAKLSDVRTEINVVSGESGHGDADICKKIINGTFQKVNFQELAEQANMWSEMTGTAFYKIVWDNNAGAVVGSINNTDVAEGDVRIIVCSPFEIYPDNLAASDINECRSIIHAKQYPNELIKEIWGEKVSLDENVLVIEYYEQPCSLYPNGRLLIVAGTKLLYKGELPYINQSGGKRGLPFVRQCSELAAGCFYGRSVIERAIPIQKAYNSVKNRKAEFLNRLACGVVSAEEGSVDLESLENDGLAPGKVIVYRQGTNAPKFMDCGGIPAELEREEERLLNELIRITGGTDLSRAASDGNVSGVALQILVEQNNLRMLRAINSVKKAYQAVGAQILRLYKQFAATGRLGRVVVDNVIQSFYWNAEEITSDEVVGG